MDENNKNENGTESAGLREVWRFAARNRLWMLGAPVLVLALTILFVSTVTPTWGGLATIRIDKQRAQFAMLEALDQLGGGASEIGTEMAEMRSRSLGEDVVEAQRLNVVIDEPSRVSRNILFKRIDAPRTARSGEFELRRTDGNQFELKSERGGTKRVTVGESFTAGDVTMTLAPEALEHESIRFEVIPFQIAVRELADRVDVIRPDREAGIVQVRYQTTDRELARDVPNEMASRFIARRQRNQTSQARSTVAFLQEQIDTLTSQLRAFESGLLQFREAGTVVSLEAEGEAQVKRLAEFQATRDVLNSERNSLQQLLNQVASEPTVNGASPFRRLIGFPTLLSNPVASELLNSLNELDNKRSELLMRRTVDDPDVQNISRRINDIENQVASLTATYLQGLNNRVASLDRTLASFGADLRQIPAKEIQLARLRRQAHVSEELYLTLQQRMKESEIMAASEDPSVRIVDPAIYPLKPVKPNIPLSIFLALLIGMVLGGLAAFVRENLDNTIHTREELQTESGMVPVLGLIPSIDNGVGSNGTHRLWKRTPNGDPALDRRSRLIAGSNPRAAASEAYRSLRTNIVFSRPDKPPKIIVFTSPAPGDGKSTSAANLTITLAQQKLRCIVVDADMRRGAMHQAFEATSKPGLSDYLLGGLSLEQVIRPIQVGEAKFDFIPTGTLPPNPAELIASTRMQALMEHLDGQYDTVIFDAPPLNVVTDAALLGSKSDGVIVVVRAGITDRSGLRHAYAQLNAVHAKVIGCLLNDVDAKRERLYGEYVAGEY